MKTSKSSNRFCADSIKVNGKTITSKTPKKSKEYGRG